MKMLDCIASNGGGEYLPIEYRARCFEEDEFKNEDCECEDELIEVGEQCDPIKVEHLIFMRKMKRRKLVMKF